MIERPLCTMLFLWVNIDQVNCHSHCITWGDQCWVCKVAPSSEAYTRAAFSNLVLRRPKSRWNYPMVWYWSWKANVSSTASDGKNSAVGAWIGVHALVPWIMMSITEWSGNLDRKVANSCNDVSLLVQTVSVGQVSTCSHVSSCAWQNGQVEGEL